MRFLALNREGMGGGGRGGCEACRHGNGEFDKLGDLCAVEKCILPMHFSVMCFGACNSDFINEFKPNYVMALSYQVVCKFAWRYS